MKITAISLLKCVGALSIVGAFLHHLFVQPELTRMQGIHEYGLFYATGALILLGAELMRQALK